MTLEQYLRENGLTDAAFGELVNVSQSQISRIRRGVSWPSKDVVSAIEEATRGAVTANDILRVQQEAAQ